MAVIVIAVVVIAAAVAAFFLVPRLLGSDDSDGDSGPVGGPGEPPVSGEAADPVDVMEVEDLLGGMGFACYDIASEPAPIRSCYRTEPDGAATSVFIQTEPDGLVGFVEVRSEDDRYLRGHRGDGTVAFPEVYEAVAEALLGEEAADIPSLELEGEDWSMLAWGEVSALMVETSGRATFERDGFAATRDLPESPGDPDETRQGLEAAGYDCADASLCTKGPVTGDLSRQVRVQSHGGFEATLSEQDGVEVTVDEAVSEFTQLAEVAISGDDLATATEWIADNIDPEHGVARADFTGTHVRVERDGTATAVLTIGAAEL